MFWSGKNSFSRRPRAAVSICTVRLYDFDAPPLNQSTRLVEPWVIPLMSSCWLETTTASAMAGFDTETRVTGACRSKVIDLPLETSRSSEPPAACWAEALSGPTLARVIGADTVERAGTTLAAEVATAGTTAGVGSEVEGVTEEVEGVTALVAGVTCTIRLLPSR